MTTPSSILAWRIPWAEEPGRLQSVRSQRVRHDWWINTFKTWKWLVMVRKYQAFRGQAFSCICHKCPQSLIQQQGLSDPLATCWVNEFINWQLFTSWLKRANYLTYNWGEVTQLLNSDGSKVSKWSWREFEKAFKILVHVFSKSHLQMAFLLVHLVRRPLSKKIS